MPSLSTVPEGLPEGEKDPQLLWGSKYRLCLSEGIYERLKGGGGLTLMESCGGRHFEASQSSRIKTNSNPLILDSCTYLHLPKGLNADVCSEAVQQGK